MIETGTFENRSTYKQYSSTEWLHRKLVSSQKVTIERLNISAFSHIILLGTDNKNHHINIQIHVGLFGRILFHAFCRSILHLLQLRNCCKLMHISPTHFIIVAVVFRPVLRKDLLQTSATLFRVWVICTTNVTTFKLIAEDEGVLHERCLFQMVYAAKSPSFSCTQRLQIWARFVLLDKAILNQN